MERLTPRRKRGINGNTLRAWGWMFLITGIAGRGLIQTHMLGMKGADMQTLLQILESSETAMILASVSIILQAAETCAVPIFALLTVEGMMHTSNRTSYFLRVLGLAAVSEIPYNLALSGEILDFSGRNHVFGIVLAMVMLYFWERYAAKGLKGTLIKFALSILTIAWCRMLKVDSGAPLVILVAVLWIFREKANYRVFAGAATAACCTVFSPFYLASPMAFLAIHAYNGEAGTGSKAMNYLIYPAVLLLVAAVGMYL